MKNYLVVYFFLSLFFCAQHIVAATSTCRDTIPPASLEKEAKINQQNSSINEQYPAFSTTDEETDLAEVKEPTMTDEEADNQLIIAKDRTRKAKNALIFTVLTAGAFYPLALYWLIAALGPAIRARRHYRSFSKNQTLIKDAEATYQTTITLLIIHLLSLFAVVIVTNSFDLSSFEISDAGGLSLFSILLAAIADFFVFNLFIPNRWKKNK